jgi:putative colanic acid biosynthesis acetyltransferase WcaF
MDRRTIISDRVDCYNMALIAIREGAIVSHDAVLCAGTHAIDDPGLALIVKPIEVGREAWIASGAFVGPGVSVAEGAVLGARAVAFGNLEPWGVYVGNPARKLRQRKPFELPKTELDGH